MPLNTIIVDDEPAARSMLRQIILEYCPMITLVGEATDVKSAVKLINKQAVNLVFLDIEMPEENGFTLFEYFTQPSFETIFCTAYSEFALRAFEVSAIDYILKPVSISKVLAAVEKVEKVVGKYQFLPERVNVLKESLDAGKLQKIALPMSDGLVFVLLDDILFFEADGSYTKIIMKSEQLLVSKKIKEFDELLTNDDRFYRTHRSYLINLRHIVRYSKKEGATVFFENESTASVAREKVKEFDEFVANLKV